MIYLKQSTASQEVPIGPMVDSTDAVTAETGLTIANTDIKLWFTGATTLASKNSGGATHISNGNYYAVLDATDTATVGSGRIIVQVAGACPYWVDFCVLPANVYDALIGGTDLLDVSTTQLAGQTVTAAAGVTFPTSVASPTNITAGTITTVTNLTNAPTAGDLTATMKTSVATAALTTQVTEAYRADGAAPTLAQGLCELLAHSGEKTISGTTLTLKKFDGTTTAGTFTLNDATTPTSITRAS